MNPLSLFNLALGAFRQKYQYAHGFYDFIGQLNDMVQ